MKEQEKQLKPGEYHITEAEKVLAGGSGLVIGGVVAAEVAVPASGGWWEAYLALMGGAAVIGAGLGLLDVLRHRNDVRKASDDGKK
jgi:hypothetical protein